MPSDRRTTALYDIRDSILLASAWIEGHDAESLAADTRTLYAIVRCLEIISEAARRLDDETLSRHPEQPWKRIRGSGNIYRHEYDNVASRFVYATVRDHLPSLLEAVTQEIARLG
jgi:uncharacterized protein with HEPN domain